MSNNSLLSVGLDVGTTTTQLIVSSLQVENRATAFQVPDLSITQRNILYQSPIHFTPLLDRHRIDADGIRSLVIREYEAAGITREAVDTGAVIITGETSRKENAAAVVQALSDLAGEFVVATAGPDLESILAAQGSGAVQYSRETGKPVLNIDIGGGTSNFAWIRDGKITATHCINVGGRLIKFDPHGTVTEVSPVLDNQKDLCVGHCPSLSRLRQLAQDLTDQLEAAAGPEEDFVTCFSGGVAECIRQDFPPLAFGDLGPLLGATIRQSPRFQNHIFCNQTIRATVIGAGCHSTQLSGSTIFHRGISFPLRDLPVAPVEEFSLPALSRPFVVHDTTPILSLPDLPSPSYHTLTHLADALLQAIPTGSILLSTRQDLAKALGQILALRTTRPILCMDRLELRPDTYLDVTAPVGPALGVIIKTLVFH